MVEVTIIIPTYNRADVLQRSIDSALNQDFPDIEIIVVDDCSSDHTPTVMSKYESKKLRFIQLEKNRGANAARNTGVKQAAGNYIMFLDSDDKLHPQCVRETINMFKQASNRCGGIFTSYQEINKGVVKKVSIPKKRITFEDIIDGNIIGGFTGKLFPRDVFKRVGYLDEQLQESQDYDFYLRVLEWYDMIGVNKVLYNWYRRDDRLWDQLDGTIDTQRYFLEKHGKNLSTDEKIRRYNRIGYTSIKNGRRKEASIAFKNGLFENPYKISNVYLYIISLMGIRCFNLLYTFGKRMKNSHDY